MAAEIVLTSELTCPHYGFRQVAEKTDQKKHPGDTRGSVVYLWRDTYLFSGRLSCLESRDV
jgi:hypothetical protein